MKEAVTQFLYNLAVKESSYNQSRDNPEQGIQTRTTINRGSSRRYLNGQHTFECRRFLHSQMKRIPRP